MRLSTLPAFGLRRYAVLGAALLLAGCGDEPTGPFDGPRPTIISVQPTTGTAGTDLRITGSNFRSGAAVTVGGLSATDVEVIGSDLFARVPPEVTAGTTYDITVRNTDAATATLSQAFSTVPPTLRFVNAATKPSGNPSSTVIVEGNAFGDIRGGGRVLFSDGAGGTVASAITGAEDWTDTFILTTVSAGADSGPVFVETATGQSESLPFTITQNATFSPSTISWTQTESLPVGLSGHSATFVPIVDETGITVQRVYVVGGTPDDSMPTTGVRYSSIQTDGSLTAWLPGSQLARGVTHHGTVAATPFNSKVQGSGYLYVLGGIEENGGGPVGTISRIPLNQDGTTDASEPAGTLPVSLHSLGAAVFRSTIYLAGGAETDDSPVSSVYRAAIDSLGHIGQWEELPSLPEARAYHHLVSFGGFLYAVGGDTDAVSIDEAGFHQNQTKLSTVAHARINLRSGLLPLGWVVSGSAMQKARSKHQALAAGGSLFVSSGLYAAAGNGSSENIFATINPDGSLGSFNGATGSNTLESVGGVNLFNTRAIGYVDGDGVAHVMILGGDDVNDPGSKSEKAIFY